MRTLQSCKQLNEALVDGKRIGTEFDTSNSYPGGLVVPDMPGQVKIVMVGDSPAGPLCVLMMGQDKEAPARVGVLAAGWDAAYTTAAGATFEFSHTITAAAAADVTEHGLAGLAKLGLDIPGNSQSQLPSHIIAEALARLLHRSISICSCSTALSLYYLVIHTCSQQQPST
jgi:hypothetical protein